MTWRSAVGHVVMADESAPEIVDECAAGGGLEYDWDWRGSLV